MRSLSVCLSVLVMLVLISPAQSAFASDSWCDSDPILVIHTPAGNLVPVFYNVGARNLLFTPDTLLGALAPAYTAVPVNNGRATRVSLSVTVPTLLLSSSFATRVIVSTGAFGTGAVYANTDGVSGQPMTSIFQVPYP